MEQIDKMQGWRGRRWCSRDSGRLRVLRQYGFTLSECAVIMDKPLRDVASRVVVGNRGKKEG